MVPPLLELIDVWAVRGGQPALCGIGLAVPRGARVGLFGRGGSGKTSLLKIVAGLWRPSKGELRWSPRRPSTGMVFQRDALFDALPLLENVIYPRRSPEAARPEHSKEKDGSAGRRAEAEGPEHSKVAARRALRAVGLGAEDEGKRPSELSGGMRKRAGVARVLCAAPALKLYDEPVAGLDPATAGELLDVLAAAHDPEGATIVASADPGPLWARLDLAAILDGGRLVASGAPAELARHPGLRALLGLDA